MMFFSRMRLQTIGLPSEDGDASVSCMQFVCSCNFVRLCPSKKNEGRETRETEETPMQFARSCNFVQLCPSEKMRTGNWRSSFRKCNLHARTFLCECVSRKKMSVGELEKHVSCMQFAHSCNFVRLCPSEKNEGRETEETGGTRFLYAFCTLVQFCTTVTLGKK